MGIQGPLIVVIIILAIALVFVFVAITGVINLPVSQPSITGIDTPVPSGCIRMVVSIDGNYVNIAFHMSDGTIQAETRTRGAQ